DGFFIERPEVLDRAAAAADDQDIWPRNALQQMHAPDRGADFARGAVALNFCVGDDDVRRPAREDDFQQVLYRRAGGARHDADDPRERRDRALAFLIEETFRGKLAFELLERDRQRAGAQRLHAVDDELVLATRLVDRDPAGRHDARAVLRHERQALRGL